MYAHKTIDGIHMLTIAYLHHNEMNIQKLLSWNDIYLLGVVKQIVGLNTESPLLLTDCMVTS